MPLAQPNMHEVVPAGLTQVPRAQGLTPILGANSAFTSSTSLAISRCVFGSNITSGLSIMPVIETPNNASRSTISLLVFPK